MGMDAGSLPTGHTKQLAQFVIGMPVREVPDAALDVARHAFVDTIACALAGLDEPASELAAQWVDEGGGRAQAAIWGRRLAASTADAAFANGIASHAIDFDDAMPTLRGHPSTTLVPVALAVGQASGSSGESVLAAYTLGLEVAGKLATAVGDGHYFRGWHTTATIGVLASTAVAARLWKLTPQELCMAWGLAASQSSGLVRNFGSMAKPFHAGHAARGGVVSAWLAKRGFTAEPAIFDVAGGFMTAYAGEQPAAAPQLDGLAQPWEILQPGLYFKRWPCCYANHRPVGGILRLVAEHGIRADEIEAITIGFLPGGDSALISTDPRTGLQAKFSIEYCAAAILLDGALGLHSFTDPMVQRPEVRTLMAKVRRVRLQAEGCYSGLKGYTDVTLHTRRGEFHLRVDRTPGSPEWPMGEDEREEKFNSAACPVLGEAGAAELFALLRRFRSLADVNGLVQATMPEGGPSAAIVAAAA